MKKKLLSELGNPLKDATFSVGGKKVAERAFFRSISDMLNPPKKRRPKKAGVNDELLQALKGLVADVRRKPNDTRYSTHLKIADEAIKNAEQKQPKKEQ